MIHYDGILIFDVPLAFTTALFFVLSWLYALGLLRWSQFRLGFAWDLASTLGIACVVSCAYAFIWIPRSYLGYNPIPDLLQVPYDLAIVFLAALPGMTIVRIKNKAWQWEEIARLRKKVKSQEVMMHSIEVIVRETMKKESQKTAEKILDVLELRDRGLNISTSSEQMVGQHLN